MADNVQALVQQYYRQESASRDDGIFADERVRNFFAQIKTLVQDVFSSLYTQVQNNFVTAEQHSRFIAGLGYFHRIDPVQGSADELQRAQQRFPGIAQEYQVAMVAYGQAVYGDRVGQMSLHVPKLDSFLYQLYTRIADSPEMRNLDYFRMSYVDRDLFIKDMLRLTMREGMTVTNTGGSTGHILPSDSVSNAPLRSHRPRSTVESMMEAASQAGGHQSSGLTVGSLARHDQQMSQRENRSEVRPDITAPVAPPSRVSGTRRSRAFSQVSQRREAEETKEVDLGAPVPEKPSYPNTGGGPSQMTMT